MDSPDTSAAENMDASLSVSATTAVASRKTPPMRRSCELCRASKTKCLPSGDSESRKCQRCTRDGRECYFAPAQQRAKRAHKSQLRVAEMEKKLDGIFALLSSNQAGSSQTPPQVAAAPIQGPSPPDTAASSTTSPHPSIASAATHAISVEATENSSVCADFFNARGRNPNDNEPPIPGEDRGAPAYQDLIERQIINPVAASVYLARFNSHVTHFPFIILPPESTVEELRRDRPFLLLAIITMGAPLHSEDQIAAEREFREFFARRYIVEGEKTLDILQGLMVYIAWYHRYFHPKRQNFWGFTHIIVALTVELGINKPKKVFTEVDPFNPGNGCGSEPLAAGKASAVEARRTLLGVYWLVSILSNSIRKPTIFHYTSYINDCCNLLTELHEAPTDSLLRYFIQFSKLADDISMTFGFDGSVDTRALSAFSIELSLKSFQARLAEIRANFSKEAEETVALMMFWRYMRMYVAEISLYVPYDSQSALHSWTTSPVRTTTLIDFLSACREFLDEFLTIPWNEISKGTALETTRLIYVMMLLSFACLDMQSPPMPLPEIRETAQLPTYLDAMMNLVGSHITVYNGVERKDLYWQFRFVFQKAKDRYFTLCAPKQPQQLGGQNRHHSQSGSAMLSPADSQADSTLGMNCPMRDGSSGMLLDNGSSNAAMSTAMNQPDQWGGMDYSYAMDISDDQFWAEMIGSMPSMIEFN